MLGALVKYGAMLARLAAGAGVALGIFVDTAAECDIKSWALGSSMPSCVTTWRFIV